ncbi:MAG: hypothetical protein OHK0013_26710 [Sandaracinaceae bacterium]
MVRASTLDRRTMLALAGLWAVATALNLFKPFHVDDAYYVAQAEWIAAHPDRPTSGLVFWDTDQPVPFHATGNNPPLVPFVYAAVIRVLGPSELALHAVTSVFTALVVALFHRLAARHAPAHALALTTALVLGPAFVAEQNVMLEPALLTCWLAFFVAFGDGAEPSSWWRAAAIASVALLVKFTSVALLLFLVIEAARTGRAGRLAVLALPASTLAAWSAWNLVEHGGAQVIDRPLALVAVVAGGSVGEALALLAARGALWVVVLGAIAPGLLVAPFVAHRCASRAVLLFAFALALLFAAGRLVVAWAAHEGPAILAQEPWLHTLLRGAFLLAGLAGLELACRRVRAGDETDRRLATWLASAAIVAVVGAPFAAARHVLLALPPLLILVSRGATLRSGATRAMVAVTTVVGVLAAIADHRAATLYAEAPDGLLAPHRADGGTTYFVGHWGFQRYATQAGLVPYVAGRTALAPADRLVVPIGVHRQPLAPEDTARLGAVAEVVVPAGPLDVVRTLVDGEGLYCSWAGLPWSLRTDARERFVVLGLRGP